MKTFKTKTYSIATEKLRGKRPVKFALLADMHGLSFGRGNSGLFRRIMLEKPDAVLIAGDMTYSGRQDTMREITGFMRRLAGNFRVYYALGNHETRMMLDPLMSEEYCLFEKNLSGAGVRFLHNEHDSVRIQGTDFVFYGLELPVEYYRKPKPPVLTLEEMETLIGKPDREGIHVLLAHSPRFGKTYFSWGADLILSGHYHGGMVRFTERRGLISPYFQPFPAFCCGEFKKKDSRMIVSAGLGEHTIPIRIHNPRELVFIELTPPAGGRRAGERTAVREKQESTEYGD
ncbi:MAG TPA: metallophosphoesterase [Candidatus Blautia faecipullorum]|nr:metallophosphoesterase [Candidatus Blautia faecipullorum]